MSRVEGRILIADDEHEIAQQLGHLVHREGLTPLLAKDGKEALKLVRAGDPDVLLADLRMPGMDGMELMRKVREIDPELPVILMTGYAEVQGAVRAIRAGAHDYLAKPFDHSEVIRVVLRALNERRLKLDLKRLADHVHNVLSPRETFGPSQAAGRVIAAIERVAKSNLSVLIVGETGSGKEVVARAIHQASGRARHPFGPVDCGAIPEMLFESELFGHERGAFTGADQQTVGKIEATHTGTLFLDEIPNMPLAAQAKLLRVLQEKILYRVGGTKPVHVDVRMLTASGHDVEALCARGAFRPDLFYRLNEYTISIPPLRERREDIVYLAKRFLDIADIELSKSIEGFSPPAIEAMLAYRWPGNVRQLRSVVRRAVSDGRGCHYRRASRLAAEGARSPGQRRTSGTLVSRTARPGVGRSSAAGNRPEQQGPCGAPGDRPGTAENRREQDQGSAPAPGRLQDPAFEGEGVWNSDRRRVTT